MTDTPGDGQKPHDPHQDPSRPFPDREEAQGYWQQQARQPPYGYGAPQGAHHGQVQYAPDHPKATTTLVVGILALVLCQLLGPFAWAMGKKTLQEIDGSQGRLGGRGAAQAGYVLGIISTALLVLSVLLLLLVGVAGLGLAGLGAMTYGG